MTINNSSTIYYKLTHTVFNDNQCTSFNHSISETKSCNSIEYGNECCKYIEHEKNLTFDICSNFIKDTCYFESSTVNTYILGFFSAFGILCMVLIIILIILYIYIYCCDKWCCKHRYETIN